MTVHYTDGTSQSFDLNIADWYADFPAVGDQIAATTSSWNFQSNSLGPHPVSVYFASVPLADGKTLASDTLPILSGAGGTTAMHIFAMATGTGTPTTGAPYASLAAAYDNVGITDNSNPAPGNFDGTGDSFSSQALAAGTPTPLTPGGHATFGGTTFTWPSIVGAPDDVIADGQIVDISGPAPISDSSEQADSAPRPAPGLSPTPTAAPNRSASPWPTGTTPPVAGDQIATTTSS